MTATPFNWKPHAGRALEAALNRALALDPETRDSLGPLDGRRVALTVQAASGTASPLALQAACEVGVAGDVHAPDRQRVVAPEHCERPGQLREQAAEGAAHAEVGFAGLVGRTDDQALAFDPHLQGQWRCRA